VYVAIAKNVRDRILDAYGIEAEVVYPPVNTKRFEPRPRGSRLLVVSRLLPYKRVDLVVKACTRAKIGLDVVGDGPSARELRAIAGPTVRFHGAVSDEVLVELIEACSAVCTPGTEDFGIVPVEGNAAGKPALAYADGGALETITDGVNGVLFDSPTVDSVLDAIRRLDSIDADPHTLASAAERFSVERFHRAMRATVRRAIDNHRVRENGGREDRLNQPLRDRHAPSAIDLNPGSIPRP
jgi:glycosyltransferase involved in cell wall biosynthesis